MTLQDKIKALSEGLKASEVLISKTSEFSGYTRAQKILKKNLSDAKALGWAEYTEPKTAPKAVSSRKKSTPKKEKPEELDDLS